MDDSAWDFDTARYHTAVAASGTTVSILAALPLEAPLDDELFQTTSLHLVCSDGIVLRLNDRQRLSEMLGKVWIRSRASFDKLLTTFPRWTVESQDNDIIDIIALDNSKPTPVTPLSVPSFRTQAGTRQRHDPEITFSQLHVSDVPCYVQMAGYLLSVTFENKPKFVSLVFTDFTSQSTSSTIEQKYCFDNFIGHWTNRLSQRDCFRTIMYMDRFTRFDRKLRSRHQDRSLTELQLPGSENVSQCGIMCLMNLKISIFNGKLNAIVRDCELLDPLSNRSAFISAFIDRIAHNVPTELLETHYESFAKYLPIKISPRGLQWLQYNGHPQSVARTPRDDEIEIIATSIGQLPRDLSTSVHRVYHLLEKAFIVDIEYYQDRFLHIQISDKTRDLLSIYIITRDDLIRFFNKDTVIDVNINESDWNKILTLKNNLEFDFKITPKRVEGESDCLIWTLLPEYTIDEMLDTYVSDPKLKVEKSTTAYGFVGANTALNDDNMLETQEPPNIHNVKLEF